MSLSISLLPKSATSLLLAVPLLLNACSSNQEPQLQTVGVTGSTSKYGYQSKTDRKNRTGEFVKVTNLTQLSAANHSPASYPDNRDPRANTPPTVSPESARITALVTSGKYLGVSGNGRLRFEPSPLPADAHPAALMEDVVIGNSLQNKLKGDPELQSFECQSKRGIVQIRTANVKTTPEPVAKALNYALTIPGVLEVQVDPLSK